MHFPYWVRHLQYFIALSWRFWSGQSRHLDWYRRYRDFKYRPIRFPFVEFIDVKKADYWFKFYGILVFSCVAYVPSRSQMVNQGLCYVSHGTELAMVSSFENRPEGYLMNDGEIYAYQDFVNHGGVDYNAPYGLINFVGSTEQELGGEAMSFFNDVTFNNDFLGTAFRISGAVDISGHVNFGEGIVRNDLSNWNLVFAKGSVHRGAYSGSYVNGPVTKIGGTSFEFPVGNQGHFMPLSISVPNESDDGFVAKYIFENPGDQYSLDIKEAMIEVIDNKGYWVLERVMGNSAVLVTLGWNEETTAKDLLIEPLSDLTVVRWDRILGKWVDHGGVVDVPNRTVTSVMASHDYGVYTLARVRKLNASTKVIPGGVVLFNALTPNGDGFNDFLVIEDIDKMRNNKVQIFDRWAVKVFETIDYGKTGNVFRGIGDWGVLNNQALPTGTYFYHISYDYDTDDGKVQRVEESGFIYLISD